MIEFRIVPDAVEDLEQAVRWYDRQSRQVGRRFRQAMKRTLNEIRRNPHAFSIGFESFRIALVRGFPYTVYFHLHESIACVIVAVFHTSRDREALSSRRAD